jgi:hypothetical protein
LRYPRHDLRRDLCGRHLLHKALVGRLHHGQLALLRGGSQGWRDGERRE